VNRPTAIVTKLLGKVLLIPTPSRFDHLYLHTERHWIPSDVRHQSFSGLGCSQGNARHKVDSTRRLFAFNLSVLQLWASCSDRDEPQMMF